MSAKFAGAHKGKVSGLCFADADRLLSCGVDHAVKLWATQPSEGNEAGPSEVLIISISSRTQINPLLP
jgi:hypothetical protein